MGRKRDVGVVKLKGKNIRISLVLFGIREEGNGKEEEFGGFGRGFVLGQCMCRPKLGNLLWGD